MTNKLSVVVLYGGRSAEHEVACRSAAFVFRNLDRQKYDVHAVGIDRQGRWWPQDLSAIDRTLQAGGKITAEKSANDLRTQALLARLSPFGHDNDKARGVGEIVVFPVLHGTYGEDGTMQGFLDLADVAYVGPDMLGSGIGMDKVVAKRLAVAAGIPVVPWIEVRRQFWAKNKEAILAEAWQKFGSPIFVKPARLGSSVGITKVKDQHGLAPACERALEYDDKILIEKGMDVREIECAVLGDYDPECSVVGEVVLHADFYDYETKYLDPKGAGIEIPAKLDAKQTKDVQIMAKKIFQALELYGMSRIDLFLDKASNKFYFNEVNTIPGFTEVSQYPMLWNASGVKAGDLLNRLIDLAQNRHKTRHNLRTTR